MTLQCRLFSVESMILEFRAAYRSHYSNRIVVQASHNLGIQRYLCRCLIDTLSIPGHTDTENANFTV